MKKLSGLLMMIFFLVSCSNDSDSGSSNTNSQITGYELRSKSVFDDLAMPTLETVTIGNLQNGKLFSETVENFSNGVSQGSPVTTQTHFYVGEDLVKQIDHSSDRVREFYYDAEHHLIGAKMTIEGSSTSYYRIVHVSDALVYFERLSLPYTDVAATILYRNVIEFDANDNIIKAGKDNNLDGVAESPNQFLYANNNLVSITWADGTVQNFDYSNVIDSFSVLNDKSYGKRNLRVIESESYVNAVVEGKFPTVNVSSEELSAHVYDVLSTNFYKKKTVTRNSSSPAGQNVITTEFFFD